MRYKKYSPLISVLVLLFAAGPVVAENSDVYLKQRHSMVEEIADDARRLVRHIDKDSVSEHVMQAMATVPRHMFVPEEMRPSTVGVSEGRAMCSAVTLS